MKKLVLALCFLFLFSCSSKSTPNKELKLQKSLDKLALDFSDIQSPSDFKNKSLQIKEDLLALAKILIEIRVDSLENNIPLHQINQRFAKHLQKELFRLMKIEGCKVLYEEASLDALYMLDAYERKIKNPITHKIKSKKIEED